MLICSFFLFEIFRIFSNRTTVEPIIWKFVMDIGISHRYWADIVVLVGLWNWLNPAAVECCSLWKQLTDKPAYAVLQPAMKVRWLPLVVVTVFILSIPFAINSNKNQLKCFEQRFVVAIWLWKVETNSNLPTIHWNICQTKNAFGE